MKISYKFLLILSITMFFTTTQGQYYLASGSKDGIKVWSPKKGSWSEIEDIANLKAGLVDSLSFNPKGLLASGSKDGIIRIWDPSQKWTAIFKSTTPPYGSTTSVAFIDKFLVSNTAGLGIKVFKSKNGKWEEIQTKKIVSKEDNRLDYGRSMVLCPKQKNEKYYLGTDFTTSYSKGIRIIEADKNWKEIKKKKDLIGDEIAFSPDGKLAINVDDSGHTIRIKSTKNWENTDEISKGKKITKSTDFIKCLVFSPKVQSRKNKTMYILIAGTYDGKVAILKIVTDKHGSSFKIIKTIPNKKINAIAFSPDNKFVTFGLNKMISIWKTADLVNKQIENPKPIKTFKASKSKIKALALTQK